MPFDEPIAEASPALPETATTFLRHALKVWARENGVADDHLPGLVAGILDFAAESVRGERHPRGLGA